MNGWLQGPPLADRRVRLEPLTMEHAPALAAAVNDGELWKLWYTSAPQPSALPGYIEQALEDAAGGHAQAFAVRRLEDDRIVGCTRYGHADAPNRRLEIGWTWYAASAQRTVVNTACKRLLLGNAFERLGCIAVELRTHWMNQRSRAAIARLGAKQDGVLRNHRRLADGSYRDTVVFSIIESEWPAVRRHLDHLLGDAPARAG